ncbi:unnamed protein product [Polarella glacialis]|uniref:Calpain catalytic domain-containing protein n=1 Tax=Polarella glacialis TaxID=89957 RepID=A0A813G3A1_POLGL|nr:unnamed protein product [Polarella glacialis]
MVIFRHESFQKWFISDQLCTGASVRFSAKSKGDAASPELAAWDAALVQEIFEQTDSSSSLAASASFSLFVDEEFPHRVTSVNRVGASRPVSLKSGEPEWIPGRKLRGDCKWKLFDGIDARDLLQGRLGNCWLIAAMAAMADYPKEIQRTFLRDGLAKGDGRYVLKLFDHTASFGCMREVTVDEYIPCKPKKWWESNADPYFASPNGNELWCLILEKAMAKIFGSYGDLDGGTASVAFRALTGVEDQVMFTKDSRQTWGKGVLAKGALNKFSYPSVGRQTFDSEAFFQHLLECDGQNFLMAASITGGREKERADGLVEGHAYSVIQVMTVTTDTGALLRLLQLRNPWGNDKEWNGAWGDHSPLWDKYPEVRRRLRPAFEDDGVFWMAWEDFLRNFSHAFVCPKAMREGEEARVHALASVDWHSFRPSAPRPKPPSHSKRPDPLKAGLATQLFRLGLRWQVPKTAEASGAVRWQVEFGDGWQDFGDSEQELLEAAKQRGAPSAHFKARGYAYEVRLTEGIQLNVSSGRSRKVRRQDGGLKPTKTAWSPKVGDAVRVWSESRQSWYADGSVLQLDAAGAIHVRFDGDVSQKWIQPGQIGDCLRQKIG